MSAPRRLVVVNDDPVQNALITGALRARGHDVRSFLDAGAALDAVADARVDLFVVDLHMPGIDGWKLCRLLRSPAFARFNATPILVVSATYTGDDVASITRDLGANAFLEAPFDAARLVAHVGELLEGRMPRTRPVVLLAVADAAERASLAAAFTSHGYRAEEAGTAERALTLARIGRVDLAVVDESLPDQSCEALVDDLRVPHPSACVMVLAASDDAALPVRLLASGVDVCLRRPFVPDYAVELAQKAGRERSLLRVETVLEARTRELRASEERYRILFDTIPDLVLVLDERRRLAEVAPDGRAWMEGAEPVLGSRLVDRVVPERAAALDAWLDALVGGRAPGPIETELKDGAGSARPMELRGRAFELRGSPALLVVGHDLTERKRAEQERVRLEAQMLHAQRLESLGVLAGGVAHDFNNLLVGILGNASLAAMDVSHDSPLFECVRQIEIAATRAAELTQQILAFGGKSATLRQDVDLSELVREMGQLVEPAASKKARIMYTLPSDLPPVSGDPGQLRQVVMNLIINASDALRGQPGDISVCLFERTLGADEPIEVVGSAPVPAGRYVVLEVADDGQGMDEATRNRIFEPFFTTKPNGRGLGLSATLGILRAHGGFLSVKSAPGEGTVMTVLLPPQIRAAAQGGEIELPFTEGWSRGGRVLVIDDEPVVRGVASAALKRSGFSVVEAADGASGLQAVLGSPRPPDLVLLDLTMPEMDGVEVLFALRTRFPRLPVLLSSGYPSQRSVDATIGPGPTAFLKKPYSARDLLDATSRLLLGAAEPKIPEAGLSVVRTA